MKSLTLLVLFVSVIIFAEKKPIYDQILNSYGFTGLRVRDDSLNVDTTGASAWKSVLNDTTNSIDVDTYKSISFSYTLALAQSDSSSFKIDVGCYIGGLSAWLWGADYTENQYYGADSMISSYTLDTNTTGHGSKELQIKQCDKIKFVFSAPAEMSNSDTVVVGVRYLRGRD